MACEQPCFDCPFLRGADKDILSGSDAFEFVYDHLTEDGGPLPYVCEEQGDECYGWKMMIDGKQDKRVFQGGWELIAYYEGNT